jgi:PST family polysaccharide transporter
MQKLRHHLAQGGVRTALQNVGWLTVERVGRMAVGAFVGIWVARYLGPDRFGLLNYSLAFAMIVGAGANLGTDTLVVRELVMRPGDEQMIVASATVLRLAGALGSSLIAVGAALLVHRREPSTALLVSVLAAATLFKPFDIVELWFQSKSRLAPAVFARSVGFLAGTLLKVGIVLLGGSVLWIAAADPIAAGVGALLLVATYWRHGRRFAMGRWQLAEVRRLLAQGWPLLFAGIAILVYMRIDQLMLAALGGPDAKHEVGLYSAALRLSEVWYFVPIAISTAAFPHVVTWKAAGESVYHARLSQLFGLVTFIALTVAIPLTFMSGPIISILYGARYAGAAPILRIHIWTTVFVFWGVIGEMWYVNEGLTRVSLYRTLTAAGVNVALNLVLIPRFGGMGAAVATLVAQAISSWALNAPASRTRALFLLQARSLTFRGFLW